MSSTQLLTKRAPSRIGYFRQRHDPRSMFLTGAAYLLAVTIICDLLLHPEDFNFSLLAVLLGLSLFFGSVVGLLGSKFPTWLAHSCVAMFTLACVVFLSPFSSEQPAVSTMQELPLIAFYLSWFVAPRTGRYFMWLITAVFALMMAFNPIFWVDGSLGVVSGSQSLIVMIVCFEFGVALRTRITRSVSTDQLTGAYNRSGFLRVLESALAKSLRSNVPMCLVVIDFDEFKQVNDHQGHAAGDRALIETVAHWKESLRGKDVVGRTGGDEFAIILKRVDATSANLTMQRLHESSPQRWSWGISEARPGDTAETLFARGDHQLYELKRSRQRASDSGVSA